MKKEIKYVFIVVIIAVIVLFFMPTSLVNLNEEVTIQAVYYFDGETGNSHMLELDADTESQILAYLSIYKKYRTLYSAKQQGGATGDYYWMQIWNGHKYTNLSIRDGVRATVGDSPFLFGVFNQKQISESVKDMLQEAEAIPIE